MQAPGQCIPVSSVYINAPIPHPKLYFRLTKVCPCLNIMVKHSYLKQKQKPEAKVYSLQLHQRRNGTFDQAPKSTFPLITLHLEKNASLQKPKILETYRGTGHLSNKNTVPGLPTKFQETVFTGSVFL